MSYYQLTTETIPEYLASIEAMKSHFSDFSQLDVSEIGDGNLNYVYKIVNVAKPNETAILKQAVPYLRVIGESYPLTRERMTIEIMALESLSENSAKHVPEVYYSSKDMSVLIMEYLGEHQMLRDQLIQGIHHPCLSNHVSTLLARQHFNTSDCHLSPTDKKELVQKFPNIELRNITEDFVFSHPVENHETNVYNPELSQQDLDYIFNDGQLKIAVAEMKYAYQNHSEALIHGDMHTGSLMVTDNDTRAIDAEFAFVGPIGFDTGTFIANIFLAYFSWEYHQKEYKGNAVDYRQKLVETAINFWTCYASKFDSFWAPQQIKQEKERWGFWDGEFHSQDLRTSFLKHVFCDTLGFAGTEIIRRILGLAKVADISSIEDLKARAKIERSCLKFARELLVNRKQYSTITDVATLATQLSPLYSDDWD